MKAIFADFVSFCTKFWVFVGKLRDPLNFNNCNPQKAHPCMILHFLNYCTRKSVKWSEL